ncbi:MAG: hypothetical protein PVF33_09995, partial [Candidatus Latescibacterota bacterium]
EFDWDVTTLLDMRVTHVLMSVPDSTGIDYQSFIPSVEFRHLAGLNDRIALQASLERRDYVLGSPRSSFWAVYGLLAGEWSFTERNSFLLESDTDWYSYDFKDPVYFDFLENRTALMLKFSPSFNLNFGAGPSVGFLRSGNSDQDEYSELGVRMGFEYTRGSRAWVTLRYEPGKRSYAAFNPLATDPAAPGYSLFSDYTYHRLSFFANIRVTRKLNFSGFVDYQPEDHKREGDDATATLVSVSLYATF